jgi:hypothetical protein
MPRPQEQSRSVCKCASCLAVPGDLLAWVAGRLTANVCKGKTRNYFKAGCVLEDRGSMRDKPDGGPVSPKLPSESASAATSPQTLADPVTGEGHMPLHEV